MSNIKNNSSARVLVAPLDWGLGHATRCIPLVRRLLGEGKQVLLAGSGASGHLLRTEFPDLKYEEIPSHEVQYARTGKGLIGAILKQTPQLLRQIREERKWLDDYTRRNAIEEVISDNRYGLHHPSLHNILLTHQLGFRSGISPLGDWIVRKILFGLLKNFDEIWVPDHENEPTLSGELGHPKYLPPVPIRYIGPLSRFTLTHSTMIPRKITIVLSGPEPQRTQLEEKCILELAKWKGEVSLIRGLPLHAVMTRAPGNWKVVDHLNSKDLQQEIEEAERVIARCGYSTLMDLTTLKKPAMLIPTPGQPEQLYLSKWVRNRPEWVCIRQDQPLWQALLRSMGESDSDV